VFNVLADFEELLASLNAAGVRYIVGGAHALAYHARPRATKDLDVFVDPTKANARRTIRAIQAFFGGTAPSYVSESALLDPDTIIQLGVAPLRIDLLSAFGTMDFKQAWRASVKAHFGQVETRYLSREHLIAEKLHFRRAQDLADVRALRRVAPAPVAPVPAGRWSSGRKPAPSRKRKTRNR
jgi:hypothetical protein